MFFGWGNQKTKSGQWIFFFCLFILVYDLYRSWRHTFCPVFLSQERVGVPKEINKGENKRKAQSVYYFPPTNTINEGVGWSSGSSSLAPILYMTPSTSSSSSCSSCYFRHSQCSHSDTSLPASPSSSSGDSSLPMSIEGRKSSTACPLLPSASRSRTILLLFHLLVSFSTSVHSTFCCIFHSGYSFKR